MKKITKEWLLKNGANAECYEFKKFVWLFSGRANVTTKNLTKAESEGLDIGWVMGHLPERFSDLYDAAEAYINAKFDALTWEEEEVRKSSRSVALNEYHNKTGLINAEYELKKEKIDANYKEQAEALAAEYRKITDDALGKLNAATHHYRQYGETYSLSVTDYEFLSEPERNAYSDTVGNANAELRGGLQNLKAKREILLFMDNGECKNMLRPHEDALAQALAEADSVFNEATKPQAAERDAALKAAIIEVLLMADEE